MSFQAMTWAVRQRAGSTHAKAVLLALANVADSEGYCFVGQKRIADETEQTVRSVQLQMQRLEEAGLIRREERRRDDGTRTTDGIWLNLQGEPASPDQGEHASPDPAIKANATTSQGEHGSGQGYEPPLREPDEKRGARPADLIRLFDQARVSAYGPEQRRPYPKQTDRVIAERWIAAGADAALIEGLFAAVFPKLAAEGRSPPDSLKFFDRSVADLIAERSRPMPEGQASPNRPFGRSSKPNAVMSEFDALRDEIAEAVG